MGKFSDAFDEQARIAEDRNSTERAERDKINEEKRQERQRIMTPLREIVDPVIKIAEQELAAKKIRFNHNTSRQSINYLPEHCTYFMLQRDFGNPGARFVFAVAKNGSVYCDRTPFRSDDRSHTRVFHCQPGELTTEMVEQVVIDAIAELNGNEK